MRLVIDTNIWVSALGWPKSRLAAKLEDLVLEHTILFSTVTLQELRDTLSAMSKKDIVSPEQAQEFPVTFTTFAIPVSITSKIEACRDPSDNKFLALAVDGKADVIVTGDEDLLTLHPFRGVRILRLSAL